MVFEVDVDFKVYGIKTRRMRGIYFRECSAGLHPGSYLYEFSMVELILMYTKGDYVYEVHVYTEPTHYDDAPPNPPVMPSETHGTVRMSTEGVATRVEYELEVFPIVGFNINYPIMSVWYGFAKKNVEMGRYAKRIAGLGAANWLKPNPASVVV